MRKALQCLFFHRGFCQGSQTLASVPLPRFFAQTSPAFFASFMSTTKELWQSHTPPTTLSNVYPRNFAGHEWIWCMLAASAEIRYHHVVFRHPLKMLFIVPIIFFISYVTSVSGHIKMTNISYGSSMHRARALFAAETKKIRNDESICWWHAYWWSVHGIWTSVLTDACLANHNNVNSAVQNPTKPNISWNAHSESYVYIKITGLECIAYIRSCTSAQRLFTLQRGGISLVRMAGLSFYGACLNLLPWIRTNSVQRQWRGLRVWDDTLQVNG